MKESIPVFPLLGALCVLPFSSANASESPAPPAAASSTLQARFLRLRPGEEVLGALQTWARQNSVTAASILSAVGSLKKATLRFADQPGGESIAGPLEVVSLSGTLSRDSHHLHASVADAKGTVRGGHLTGESRVYTTLELVIGVYPEVRFEREKDPASGWPELVIRPAGGVR